ncbi:MAG: small-conductance mechanosensitive [Desulfobulbaceae bacterium]|nr:MAG: small-conductance mechanosensitive [Desulfobulbaceae bacterium]
MPNLKRTLFLPARLMLLFVLVVFWLDTGRAAELLEIPKNETSLVSPEILKAKTDEIAKSSTLDEATKTELRELYRRIQVNLTSAASSDVLAKKFAQYIETGPGDIRKIREKMAKPLSQDQPTDATDDDFERVSLKDIEQQLLKAKANYAALETDLLSMTRQLNVQKDRPVLAGHRLAEIIASEKKLLDVIKEPVSGSPLVMEARGWMQQTQLQALHSEAGMLNQELVSMPVLVELANVQREAAAGRMEAARIQVQGLEAKVNRKRQAEAARSVGQAEEAMRQVADSPAVLQQAAALNASLGDDLQGVINALDRIVSEKESLERELKKLEESSKNAKQKIELAGLSQALGLLMYEQRRNLPDARLLKKKIAQNGAAIAETGLLQVQSAEERKRLDDVEGYIAELTVGSSPDEVKALAPELRKLLIDRRDILDKIIASSQTYLGVLSEIEVFSLQLLKTVISFDSFLAERLLWMRSVPLMGLKDLQSLAPETGVFFASGPWITTAKALAGQADSRSYLLLAGIITAGLIGFRGRIITRLETAVRQAANPATYRFTVPLQAFGLTLLLALSWSLLPMTLSWQISSLPETTDFSKGVAVALSNFSYRLFILRVLYSLLRPKGLVADFFHWSRTTINLLRRESGLFTVTFLPVLFFTQLAFQISFHVGGSHILGRLILVVTLAIFTVFFYRIFHPRTGVWQRFVEGHSNPLIARLYPLIFTVIMLIPLGMVVLVFTGYIFAVGALLRCLISSLWLAFGLVVCHQLIQRWLIQSSRRLSLEKALLLSAQAKVEEGQVVGNKEAISPTVMPEEDLAELSTESRKLLDTLVTMSAFIGLWLVWADVLPALRILHEFTLWKYTSVVNGQPTPVPVTLADAGLTVFIGIITLAATRHFPSLLKIILLQHLGMNAGSRYTVTTVSGYLIGGIGMMTIANILGFSWSQIQWLVAALGVGIGFGLQEIVANFISGLIILFERPIRVGDVVTIGTTDGVVTRIRIRATTIRDFDRKELLVPNKEFIAGRLLNWSLSDKVIRILVPVGIAYGSDVDAAMTLMEEAAEKNARVLGDPKPVVTFDSFGDNALLLTLRCFIGSVDERVAVRSDLHKVIDQKFREAAISMAFPQRDVHLDTNTPLDIRIVPEKEAVPDTTAPVG